MQKSVSTAMSRAALGLGMIALLGVPSGLWAAPSLYRPPTVSEDRQYAPDREVDILHLTIQVTPDFRQRTVSGRTTLKFKPIARPLPELKLDGVELKVSAVTSTHPLQGWQATKDKVIATFAQPVPPGQEASVTITYSAEPREGLYFRTPELGYPKGDLHLFTQGEATLARNWYPGFDAPNEKFTTEIICTVPAAMEVLANGRKVEEVPGAGGLKTVRWVQDKPHVNYLVSLVAGYFRKLEDRHGEVPMAFWTVPSQSAWAASSFKDTKDMMEFFEREIGVPYPWAKYDQICVYDFVAGGMENTSQTVLTDRTLHTPEFETLRSSQGLVAHELVHQWFGDLVTCKDWSHLWLNEGFASYYEDLYNAHKKGRAAFQYEAYQSAKSIIGHADQTNSIVRRDFGSPDEQFNHLNYGKGAWVLHMLRSQLGEDLYRRCIKTYLERHQYGSVVTEDLNRVIEELSGRSFDRFFDQWVYHASQPELAISYEWQEPAKLAKISVRQDQRLSDRVRLFEVPLPVRFKLGSNVVEHILPVRRAAEDFYFPVPSAPTVVRIDPEVTVLAKIKFTPPAALLKAQLQDAGDMMGRLLAVEQMGERRDRGNVATLKNILNGDAFYGVRLEAAKALRATEGDEAFAALASSWQQEDARVRREVVQALASYYRPETADLLLKVAANDKNPDIQAAATRALAAFPRKETRALLLARLNSSSFQNVLAAAAVTALRSMDDPSCLEPLQDCLEKHGDRFTTPDFGQGLETLAWLARDQEKKEKVRKFLLEQTGSLRRRVRLAAIAALGTLGDPQATAALETFASGPPDSPERRNAERAIERIRAAEKQAPALGTLRDEVQRLQRDNRDLRKEMDDLKKKFDAFAPAASRGQTNAPAAK